MKYIKYWFDIGYHTGDDELYEQFSEDTDSIEEDIEEMGSTYFYEFCEDHEGLIMQDYEDEPLLPDEYWDIWNQIINDQCSWGWEEVTKEEYDEWAF